MSARMMGLMLTDADAALTEIQREHGDEMMSLALAICRDWALAEDAVQSTLVSVWEHADGYDPRRGSFHGWLFRILHRKCVDAKRRRREFTTDEDVVPPTYVSDVGSEIEHAEDRCEFRLLLDELPERKRAVLLDYISGMQIREIANRHETTEWNVYRWKREAITAMQEWVA